MTEPIVSKRQYATVQAGYELPVEISTEELAKRNRPDQIEPIENTYVVIGDNVYYFGPSDSRYCGPGDADFQLIEETAI